jgi:hypothetical protein
MTINELTNSVRIQSAFVKIYKADYDLWRTSNPNAGIDKFIAKKIKEWVRDITVDQERLDKRRLAESDVTDVDIS